MPKEKNFRILENEATCKAIHASISTKNSQRNHSDCLVEKLFYTKYITCIAQLIILPVL